MLKINVFLPDFYLGRIDSFFVTCKQRKIFLKINFQLLCAAKVTTTVHVSQLLERVVIKSDLLYDFRFEKSLVCKDVSL